MPVASRTEGILAIALKLVVSSVAEGERRRANRTAAEAAGTAVRSPYSCVLYSISFILYCEVEDVGDEQVAALRFNWSSTTPYRPAWPRVLADATAPWARSSQCGHIALEPPPATILIARTLVSRAALILPNRPSGRFPAPSSLDRVDAPGPRCAVQRVACFTCASGHVR